MASFLVSPWLIAPGSSKQRTVNRGLHTLKTFLQCPLVSQIGQVTQIQGPGDDHQNSKAFVAGVIVGHIWAVYGCNR